MYDIILHDVQVTSDLKKAILCDMGVAKIQSITATSCGTGAGTCVIKLYVSIIVHYTYLHVGTYPYMAPEMFKSARRGSPVDIYALGCTMIEAYGRKRVWEGLTSPEIMQKVCGPDPQPPSIDHLSAMYADLCHKCCELDQAKRPKATEVLKDLNDIVLMMD